MQRLARLAQPRSQSMARPRPPTDPTGSVGETRTRAVTVAGPPSLLSRTASARTVKSTAEREAENMERMAPFRAQRIPGSATEVKSRFKLQSRPRRTPHVSPTRPVPKPSAAQPPSMLSRESSWSRPRKRVHTFGESVQHYLNHNLRGSLPPTPNTDLSFSPGPPLFLQRHKATSRPATARSSEELELDECKKQFRASTTYHGTTPTSRRHTATACAPSTALSTEQRELRECGRKFQARPLPRAPRHTARTRELRVRTAFSPCAGPPPPAP